MHRVRLELAIRWLRVESTNRYTTVPPHIDLAIVILSVYVHVYYYRPAFTSQYRVWYWPGDINPECSFMSLQICVDKSMQKVKMSVQYEMWSRTKVKCEENIREMEAENQTLMVRSPLFLLMLAHVTMNTLCMSILQPDNFYFAPRKTAHSEI